MQDTQSDEPVEYEQPPPARAGLQLLYEQPLTVRQRHYGLMARPQEDEHDD